MPDGNMAGLEDFIVVATALPVRDGAAPPRLTKRWYRSADGKFLQQDYDPGAFLYSFERRPVSSITDVAAVYACLGPHQCFVLGDIRAGVDATCARRIKNAQADGTPPTLEDCGHNSLFLDCENLPAVDVMGSFDPVADPARAVDLIVERLPPEFQQASRLWALTSSAGFAKDGDAYRIAGNGGTQEIRLRLTFWMKDKLTLAQQKALLSPYRIIRKKGQPTTGFIDDSIYSAEHPLYGAPVIEVGITDPVPRRQGVEVRETSAVEIGELPAVKAEREPLPAPENFQPDSLQAKAAGYRELWEWLKRGDVPVDGNRNDTVYRLAARLRGLGLGEAVVRRLIEEDFLPHGEAPDEPVWAIVASAFKTATNPPGSELPRTGAEAREDDPLAPSGPKGFIDLIPLRRLFQEPDPAELIEDMLMQGEHFGIVGPPKAGKSFIAIELAAAVATLGEDVVGCHRVRRHGPVVYLSGEGHAGFKRRLMAWAQHRGIDLDDSVDAAPGVKRLRDMRFYYNKGVIPANASPAEIARVIEDIHEAIGEDPALVILDTVSRSLGGDFDENSAQAAGAYMNVAERVRQGLNTTFISIIHATNKGKPGGKIDIRGSSAFSAAFDAVWAVQLNRDTRTVEMSAVWLKEADDLGPFYFRMQEVQIASLPPGKRNRSVVLDFVPPRDGRAAMKDTQDDDNNRGGRVRGLLRERGCFGFECGLRHSELAEALVMFMRGEEAPGEDDGDARLEWDRAIERENTALKNAARTQWGKALRRGGYLGNGTQEILRWCLPESERPGSETFRAGAGGLRGKGRVMA